jgi:hypothetical protein
VGYTCSTCRTREYPDLEGLIGAIVGPCWRQVVDVAMVQAEAILAAARAGYCELHAVWLAELVGWTIRTDAARRELLASAAVPRVR